MSAPNRFHSLFAGLLDEVTFQAALARQGFTEEAVHDLRVALRRCRSVAMGIRALDPHPSWRRMNRQARALFRALGVLRDTHVKAGWLTQLTPRNTPTPPGLMHYYAEEEAREQMQAAKALKRFKMQAWRQEAGVLVTRIKDIHPESPAFLYLAGLRFEDVMTLHHQVMKTGVREEWHALRIAIKRLRYTLENFLPEHTETFLSTFKKLQDLLGEVHDLDVLELDLLAHGMLTDAEKRTWLRKLARERNVRLRTYKEITTGRGGFWTQFSKSLPQGEEAVEAKAAFLHEMAARVMPKERLKKQRGLAKKFSELCLGETGAGAALTPLYAGVLMQPVFMSSKRQRRALLEALSRARYFPEPKRVVLAAALEVTNPETLSEALRLEAGLLTLRLKTAAWMREMAAASPQISGDGKGRLLVSLKGLAAPEGG